jgi:hypothetical protein
MAQVLTLAGKLVRGIHHSCWLRVVSVFCGGGRLRRGARGLLDGRRRREWTRNTGNEEGGERGYRHTFLLVFLDTAGFGVGRHHDGSR